MNAGRKLLPMIVNWSVASDGSGSQLRIALKSDEGGYAFATPWHYQSYEERFAGLERDIQSRFA
jgi:hypothetical protein